jgi:UDP:flavonoid glycosyltransferase YjiC (YdhE family)
MKILFRTLPSYGHVYPLMPLAEAARDAGHDVMFSTAGNFVGLLRANGYPVYPAGVTVEQSVADRFGPNVPPTTVDGQTDWDVVGAFFAQAAASAADDLVKLLPEIEPDLVVYEITDHGAAIAAAVTGVASVCHSIVRGMPPEIRARFYDAPLTDLLGRYGVTTEIGQLPELVLDTYPPSLQLPSALDDPRRVVMRPVPWSNSSDSVPGWVGQHEGPLVYLTVGTIPGYFGTMETAIAGLSELDVDVLVATGALDPSGLHPLPPRVRVVPFVHHANLLRHVDLMVHHGGCGTTTGAWVHGIPQLVWPHGADHHANAEAVASSGSGIALVEPSPEQVGKAAQVLLDEPRYAYGAQLVSEEIAAMPAPAEVLPRLIDVVR